MYKNNLPEFLLQFLEAKDWSQNKLAERAKVSNTMISDIISGQVPPRYKMCVALAPVLGLKEEDVLRMAGLLPFENDGTVWSQRATQLLLSLPNEEDQEGGVAVLEAYVEHRKAGRAKNDKPKGSPKPT